MDFRFALSLCLATGATAQTAPTLAQDGLQPRIDHLSQDALPRSAKAPGRTRG